MSKLIEIISQPWPWYVSGPMIGFVMFLLLKAGGEFGVSSTLRTACAMTGVGKKVSFFDFDWKAQIWNIVFVAGAIVGGFVAQNYFNDHSAIALSQATVNDLSKLGIDFNGELLPPSLFSWESLTNFKGIAILVIGGFLVGFGSRYAGGCTSGHAISGLSNFQLPSLIAVIGFFIGGLITTFLLFPIIF